MTKVYYVKFLKHSGRVVAMTNENTLGTQGHFLRPEPLRE